MITGGSAPRPPIVVTSYMDIGLRPPCNTSATIGLHPIVADVSGGFGGKAAGLLPPKQDIVLTANSGLGGPICSVLLQGAGLFGRAEGLDK